MSKLPSQCKLPESYPGTLPWSRLATTIAIGTIITDGTLQYKVVQRLISKVPGAEPRLLLEQIENNDNNNQINQANYQHALD